MNNKWELLVKPGELAAIRSNNISGKQTYGCGGLDKIILFGQGIGQNQLNPNTNEQRERAVFLATIIVTALNREDV